MDLIASKHTTPFYGVATLLLYVTVVCSIQNSNDKLQPSANMGISQMPPKTKSHLFRINLPDSISICQDLVRDLSYWMEYLR